MAGTTASKKLTNEMIIKILLENRGLNKKALRDEFFSPKHPSKLSLSDIGLVPKSVNGAIDRIKKALKSGETVLVYGDYDTDGVCATAILWEELYRLKIKVLPFIPERFVDGYGLSKSAIEKLKSTYPDLGLIITVDNGIVANEEIEYTKKLGIDVIVTDHHLASKKLPHPLALIHTTQICGAGLSWIFAREVAKRVGGEKEYSRGLDLAGVGTISDQMPFVGINRSFVKHGLVALNHTQRLGLLALIKASGLILGKIGVYEVGFMLAPRINSSGRILSAMDSLRLVCTKDSEKADQLAQKLDRMNLDRQRIVDEVVVHARTRVLADSGRGIIVLADESYHEGVIGLAASRLVEEFYRPAVVISKTKGEMAKASARSIPGFNIIRVIRNFEGLISGGGGHPMAAGFNILSKDIDEFARRVGEYSEQLLTDEMLTRTLKADMELGFDCLSWELAAQLVKFEPTGIGNPQPVFITRGVEVCGSRIMGKEGKHLKLKLKNNDKYFDGVAFGFGSIFSRVGDGTKIDIAYSLSENEWNGSRSLQLKIRDIKIPQNA